MTIEEVASLLQCMQGETGLLARLLYGYSQPRRWPWIHAPA
ncbi:hypothetical protein HNQ01_003434 [Leptothrix sp. C29]|uniref:Uncharacterized protein n=1 Tax=Sphaerotilus uruguayifluvii TaxID=2735897 RepID=A0ABX2G6J9_9BURK|nr:hypothetical protein [Leptothrix sp. C29]